jgi:membrane fusion protein, heavy metal efflux system
MNNVLGLVKNVVVTLGFLAFLAGFLMFVGIIPPPWKAWAASYVILPPPAGLAESVELVGEYTIAVPEDVQQSTGIRKGRTENVAIAVVPTRAQDMVLPGSTALDPTRLYRIRARFAPARVVNLAPVVDEVASLQTGETKLRELRAGDWVKKGDLLGVFLSIDVGNKKSDLTDAISQRYLDEEILEKTNEAYKSGAQPLVFLLNAQRNVEADRGLETRAVNNLRVWDIPEAEIKACYDEALRLSKLSGKERDLERIKKNDEWARVELRAPDDGVVVERNICKDEMIIDPTVNLFQIARVDRLLVVANLPEDSIPAFNDIMKTTDRKWTVSTVCADARTGIGGIIDEVGQVIDPNQHTAPVKGHIDNKDGLIRAGQFVSASVPLPPPPDVVEVPVGAVSEDGQMCIVFVLEDPQKHKAGLEKEIQEAKNEDERKNLEKKLGALEQAIKAGQPVYTMRRVQVTHRFADTVFVRSKPFDEKEALSPEEEELGLLPRQPLRAGERVLTNAVGDLKKFVVEKRADKKDEDAQASK